ncbi:hypothetical protein [Streptomyces sp. NPDC056632]|uniref:hypothetical protein n=1 Tax=Streptomyces sp. NPDC056632 TaxID=3345884 RepID=UPI003677C9BD
MCLPGGQPFLLVADRGIPGTVSVNAAGERYANEAAPCPGPGAPIGPATATAGAAVGAMAGAGPRP